MKTFRCFVEHRYTKVEWYDVQAETPAKAMRKAIAAARRLPDPRETATDNGWLPCDSAIEVPAIGSVGTDGNCYPMTEVLEGVFRSVDCPPIDGPYSTHPRYDARSCQSQSAGWFIVC